jgi:acetyltransferase EpsM
MANATVNPEARLGAAVIVNTGAVVEHDVVVGDYAHIAPNATVGGRAGIGAFSLLGTGAVIMPGVFVGDRTQVGAGAVVSKRIPDDVVAYGVPATIVRKIDR